MENRNKEEDSLEEALKKKYDEANFEVSDNFWSKLDQKLEQGKVYEQAKQRSIFQRNYLLWAAASFIPVFIAFCTWYYLQNHAVKDTMAVKTPLPQTPKPALPPHANHQPDIDVVPDHPIKEETAKKPAPPVVYESGNRTRLLTLPDSSRVFMNHSSRLFYISNRKVKLNGEAYFEIKPDPSNRFQIQTNTSEIAVLGTSFNVNATNSEWMQVTVYTGKVAMHAKKKKEEEAILTPGMTGTLFSDGKIEIKQELDMNLLSWKDNVLAFDNTPLGKVKEALQRHFHVEIQLVDEALANCHFTGTFKQPELSKILNVIGATFNITYEYKSGTYLLSGKGCN